MRIAIFILSLFFLTSCFQTKQDDEMTIQIRTSRSTNRGTPLYVVVKETSMASFLVENYHQITTQDFWKEENPTNLAKKILVPGKTDKFNISVPKNKSVGIYFIFTNPGEAWKYFIDQPQSKNVKILLGKDEYEAINVYES